MQQRTDSRRFLLAEVKVHGAAKARSNSGRESGSGRD